MPLTFLLLFRDIYGDRSQLADSRRTVGLRESSAQVTGKIYLQLKLQRIFTNVTHTSYLISHSREGKIHIK
jgi:hypothetical protein